jgi:hypothetical protein
LPERRQHPRLANRFDGRWQGASGMTRCQVSDLSLGGCYVQSLSAPAVRETTVVTIEFGAHALSFHGEVVYVEPAMGFAVRFQDLSADDLERLQALMTSLMPKPQAG